MSINTISVSHHCTSLPLIRSELYSRLPSTSSVIGFRMLVEGNLLYNWLLMRYSDVIRSDVYAHILAPLWPINLEICYNIRFEELHTPNRKYNCYLNHSLQYR